MHIINFYLQSRGVALTFTQFCVLIDIFFCVNILQNSFACLTLVSECFCNANNNNLLVSWLSFLPHQPHLLPFHAVLLICSHTATPCFYLPLSSCLDFLLDFLHLGNFHNQLSSVEFLLGFHLVFTAEVQWHILCVHTYAGTSKQGLSRSGLIPNDVHTCNDDWFLLWSQSLPPWLLVLQPQSNINDTASCSLVEKKLVAVRVRWYSSQGDYWCQW